MSNKIEITKIHSIFHHNHRNYILFSTNHSQFDYLYFKHMKKNIQSLFFGNNFLIYISNLIKKNDVDCIECELGTRILGGISFDQDIQIANNLTINECNQILSNLKNFLKNTKKIIELF